MATNMARERISAGEEDLIKQIQVKFTALFVCIIVAVMAITMGIAWGASYGQRSDQLQQQMRNEIRAVAIDDEPSLEIEDPFGLRLPEAMGSDAGENPLFSLNAGAGDGGASSSGNDGGVSPDVGANGEGKASDVENDWNAATAGDAANGFSSVIERALNDATSVAGAAANANSSDSSSGGAVRAVASYPVSVYAVVDGEAVLLSGASYLTQSNIARLMMMKPSYAAIMERYDDMGTYAMRVSLYGTDYIAAARTGLVDGYMSDLAWTLLVVGLSVAVMLTIIVYAMSFAVVRPMREAWAAQRRFIADASHELRTPLSVIILDAEAAMSGKAVKEDPQAGKWLATIRDQASAMSQMVNDLLELAASADGRVKDEITEEIDVASEAERHVLQFQVLAYEKGCGIEARIEDGLQTVRVKAGRKGLDRLMNTLIDNAVKYSDEGEKITVDVMMDDPFRKRRAAGTGGVGSGAGRVGGAGAGTKRGGWVLEAKSKALGRRPKDGREYICLCVSNVGAPIPPEDADAVFERFYRADASRTGRSGYGLGLSMAKLIAENAGGRIACVPDGKATTFMVWLPVAKASS